ncbi:MAG: 50S ribosomal protein L14 [archaeon]|nr:50S ribosomal protein L14 [archaeon]
MGKKRKLHGKGSIFRVKVTRSLNVGTVIKITDNSGAKAAKILSVHGLKSRLNRIPAAAVGDSVVITVVKGTPEMRRKILRAVIVRQKKTIRRVDGTNIQFEDNAGVIISPDGDPKGTDVRGPIAREAAELFPRVASVASQII